MESVGTDSYSLTVFPFGVSGVSCVVVRVVNFHAVPLGLSKKSLTVVNDF